MYFCDLKFKRIQVLQYYNDQNLNKSIIEEFKPKKQTDFSPMEMQCFENHKNIHELNRFEKKNGTKTSPDCCVGLISSFRQHLVEVSL